MKNSIFIPLVLLLFSCATEESFTPKLTFPGNSEIGNSNNKHYTGGAKLKILTIAFGERNLTLAGPTLVKRLKESDKVNKLYFLTFAVDNSSLSVDWNPTSREGLDLYAKGLAKIDSTLAKIKGADVIRFIWIQGETDSQYLDMANAYRTNEALFLDALTKKYRIDKIINHIPFGGAYSSVVMKAKEDHATANPEINLIYIPRIEDFYNPYLTPDGVDFFTSEVAGIM
jgi:hypothetical protein